MKSNLLFHFIKRKISLTPMETILIILGELEYLEGLVKLARRRKDVKVHTNQMAIVHPTHAIQRVSVNRTHCSKTLHLAVGINHALIEGLVETGASMSGMATNGVKELGIMHLVVGHETYKIASKIVTHALGRITEFLVEVGRIIC